MLSKPTRIVVEETNRDHWVAWFADCPQVSVGGEYPSAAIQKLLDTVGGDAFDVDRISSVIGSTSDGHLEFDIAFRDRHADIIRSVQMLLGIPKPSQN